MTKIYDALCTRCGAELEFPDVAIAPESWRPPPAAGAPRAGGAAAAAEPGKGALTRFRLP